MIHMVYETINLINQMTYTGVHSTNILNDGYLGSGSGIKLAIKKYGRKNFKQKIIAICPDRAFALKLEEALIGDTWIEDSNYNRKRGGKTPFIHTNITKEKLRKIGNLAVGAKAKNRNLCIIDGIKFISQKDASKHFNVHPTTIKRWINSGGKSKLNYSCKGKNNPAARSVEVDGIIFETCIDAAQHFNRSQSQITRWCKLGIRESRYLS